MNQSTANMSIARAFTTRRVKQSLQTSDLERKPQRSGSLRHQISGPIELVHTTNDLSYLAPDIHPLSASSTASSQRSDDDMSDSAFTNGSTPPTSPDIESAPKRSMSPAPNHLSSFFTVSSQPTQFAAPMAPQRAPSHGKKQYNTLKRQPSSSGMSEKSHRTVSTKASFTFSRSSSSSTSTSVASQSSSVPHHRSKLSGVTAAPPSVPTAPKLAAAPPPRPQRKDYAESQHPFGPELAQVSELAEEFGVKEQVANVVDAEEEVMLAKGLLKFSADEYLSEVRGLFGAFFAAPPAPRHVPVAQVAVASGWI